VAEVDEGWHGGKFNVQKSSGGIKYMAIFIEVING